MPAQIVTFASKDVVFFGLICSLVCVLTGLILIGLISYDNWNLVMEMS